MEDLLRVLGTYPLEELGPIMQILARRIYAHRLENRGYVPPEIFESTVAIGGVTVAVEIAVEVGPRGKGNYALKRRGTGQEVGWKGLFQIPGATGRMDVSLFDLLQHVGQELYGSEETPPGFNSSLRYIGSTIHNEPERLATCWTHVFVLNVQDFSGLAGEWKLAEDIDPELIVDHHRETLGWLRNEATPQVADLRLYRGENWLDRQE